MGAWCPLDDWQPEPMAAPWCAYLPGQKFPLLWTASGPRTVKGSESLSKTWPFVALAAHWATEHPDQLHAFVGKFEMAHGFMRHLQMGSAH